MEYTEKYSNFIRLNILYLNDFRPTAKSSNCTSSVGDKIPSTNCWRLNALVLSFTVTYRHYFRKLK